MANRGTQADGKDVVEAGNRLVRINEFLDRISLLEEDSAVVQKPRERAVHGDADEVHRKLMAAFEAIRQGTEALRAAPGSHEERKFLRHRPKGMVDGRHWLWMAKTRHGKSEAVLSKVLLPAARAKDTAIVVADKPGTMVSKYLAHLNFYGQAPRVLLDFVRYSQRTLGYDYCPMSLNPDARERRKENEVTREWTKRKLIQRRGMEDTSKNPIIEMGLELLLDLLLYQASPKPFHWLLGAFDQGSAAQQVLCRDCTRTDVVAKVIGWSKYVGQMRSMYCEPALRIIRAFCDKQSVLERDGASFDLKGFLNGNGILLVSGDSLGNLPEESFQLVGSTVIYNVLKCVREGLDTNVLLVIDEGQGSSLIDKNLAKSFREDAKRGLSVHLCTQNAITYARGDEEVWQDTFENSNHAWGLLSHKSAEMGAEDIAIPLLDPLALKYEEKRIQSIFLGHDVISVTTRSESERDGQRTKGKSTHDQYVPVHRQEELSIKHYKTVEEQVKEVQQKMMTFTPGWWFFRDEKGVTPQPVYSPMLPDRFAANPAYADRQLEGAIQGILSRPEYREPVTLEPTWKPPETPKANEPKNDRKPRKRIAPSLR